MALNLINLDRLNRFWSDLKTWLESHYATKDQGSEADTAVQGVKLNGTILAKDGNNQVDVNLGSIVAPIYSSSSTYAVDDFVLYQNGLYRCTTAISTAEAWTASHWTLVKATDVFQGSAPGLVPAAGSGDANKALRGDGTWGDVSSVKVSYDAQAEELHLDFGPPPPIDSVKIGDRWHHYVQIGNQLWIDENLDYKIPDQSANYKYYNNDEATYGIDGVYKCGLLYNWHAVNYIETNKSTLLPNGWHVPSNDEINVLLNSLGGATYGNKLKALNNSITSNWPSNWNGTDDYGFNLLPAGKYFNGFDDLGTSAWLWSSTGKDSDNAYCKYIFSSNTMSSDYYYKTYYMSLRLVKTLT